MTGVANDVSKKKEKFFRIQDFLKILIKYHDLFNLDIEIDVDNEFDTDSKTDAEYDKLIKSYKSVIASILDEFYVEKWKKEIRKYCDTSISGNWDYLIEMLKKNDPQSLYYSIENSLQILNMLSKKSGKKKALLIIEDYCKRYSLEDVISNYNLLLDSKYAEEVRPACLRGFRKNTNIEYEYVENYFKCFHPYSDTKQLGEN